MKFADYMNEQIKKILKGEPIDRALWDVNMAIYLDLIRRGIEPEKARRAMQIFMTEN